MKNDPGAQRISDENGPLIYVYRLYRLQIPTQYKYLLLCNISSMMILR